MAWPPYTHFHTQIHSHTHTFSAYSVSDVEDSEGDCDDSALDGGGDDCDGKHCLSPMHIQVLTCSYIHTVITFIHTFLPQIHTHNTHTHSLLFPQTLGVTRKTEVLAVHLGTLIVVT